MGMGGTRCRGKKNRIYVNFYYLSVRRFEKTHYYCDTGKDDCKCRQCKADSTLVGEIERKIDEGSFVYKDYFPESKFVKEQAVINVDSNVTFGVYAQQWLDLKEMNLAYSTFKSYKTIVKKQTAFFGKMPLATIRPSHIRNYIKTSEYSPKAIANHMGVLYQIFEYAIEDEIITKNYAEKIDRPTIKLEPVDPFDKTEAQNILNWLDQHHPHMTFFFAIGLYTGMRVGEILALKWSDIDTNKHTIIVQRTMTANKLKDTTKTADYRIIDIIPDLDKYIERHRQYTFMQSEWTTLDKRGNPFKDTDTIRQLYYKPCLKALKMRERILYQMRHSFACMMIDAGEDLNWIKNMLGHSSLEMLFKRYGNRINRKDGNRRGILFSDNLAPHLAQIEPNPTESNR